MPKKQGLGRDVNKSIEVMDALIGALKDFAHMPLKRGVIPVAGEDAPDLAKKINDASEQAFALINKVEDLKQQVTSVRTDRSSRFASSELVSRVVSRFSEGAGS